MPFKIWTGNLVLSTMKSTTEIRNVKLLEENEPCSMLNFKAVGKLIEMLV